MPAREDASSYRALAPEAGAALYLIRWVWPIQTCASFGRAVPQGYLAFDVLMSRN